MESIGSEETTESLSFTECEICSKELCRRKSAGIPNICERCSEELAVMDQACQLKAETLQTENFRLMCQIINHFRELQSMKNKFFERVKDFGEIWKINRRFSTQKRDFNDSIRVLVSIQAEKEELCKMLNEKQVVLNEKNREIFKVQKMINSPVNEIKNIQELRRENWSLTEKIKGFEVEHFGEVKETLELMQILKNQVLKERKLGTFRLSGFEVKMTQLAEFKDYLYREIFEVKNEIQSIAGSYYQPEKLV